MGLKWFLHSAFTPILGHTENQSNQNGGQDQNLELRKEGSNGFQMPLHYPRYTKKDYEKMDEGKLDLLLREYGLCFNGSLEEKRAFAMGAFLWPDQL